MASFNDIMQGLTKGAGDIADNITNSGFYRNVVPTKDSFAQELAEGIGSNQKAKISYIQDTIDATIKSQSGMIFGMLGKMPQDQVDTISDEIAKALHGTDYSDEAFQKLASIMQKHQIDESVVNKFNQIAPGEIRNAINSATPNAETMMPTIGSAFSHPGLYAKTYFNNPDPKIKKQRIAAVAGTYGAVAVGGRLLSGGTITEDNYGRRDIAGIPFI